MATTPLPDIQESGDDRGIEIAEVGIDNLRYPATFSDGELHQAGVATFRVAVRLPAERRGTHMSRMVDLVDKELRTIDPRDLHRVAKSGAAVLDADELRITASMPLSVPVTSPATGRTSEQVHDITVEVLFTDGATQVGITATSEITTLCPCSKAISDYGAHNQRSIATATVWGDSEGTQAYPVSAVALTAVLRASGSAAVIPLVKRPDERALTMEAHDNPCFAEDVVRNASRDLRARGARHTVTVRNLESIHSHDAVAVVRWGLSPDLPPPYGTNGGHTQSSRSISQLLSRVNAWREGPHGQPNRQLHEDPSGVSASEYRSSFCGAADDDFAKEVNDLTSRKTSAQAVSAASKVLRDGRTSKASKTAAASALSQRARNKG